MIVIRKGKNNTQKETIMKRFISMVLTAVIMLSIVSMSMFAVSAETETDEQGVVYTLSNDGRYYIVSDCVETATNIVIPSTYNGLPVEEIGESAFEFSYRLTSVTIPDTVTYIGEAAFRYCEKLSDVTLPAYVTNIGNYAFYDCIAFKNIVIPDFVTTVGYWAFAACPYLESITVSPGNILYKSVDNCLISRYDKTLILGCKNSVIPSDGSVATIGENAFGSCAYLTSITIPDSVTVIRDFAFASCTKLTSVTMSKNVTHIGNSAFAYCERLPSITIPEKVNKIDNYAFTYCISLKNVVIPKSVKFVGKHTFYRSGNITDIYCEAETDTGWDKEWKTECNATVHWGYKFVSGNINDDYIVDSFDYLLVKRACFDTYKLNDVQFESADINSDGTLDSADYLLVKRIAFGTYKV